jgi:hypothetical protein
MTEGKIVRKNSIENTLLYVYISKKTSCVNASFTIVIR